MKIDNQTMIYNDMSEFSDMRRLARDDPDAALRKVAEQFEAIFMQMMLKSMRDASMENKLFNSEQSDFYQEMFDKQISLSMSQGQANGLADILVTQLGGSIKNEPLDQQSINNLIPNTSTQSKQQRFINTIRPQAEQAALQLGTSPDILIAQAALETGWGQGIQHHPDGRSAFNLFNIKANNYWQGPIVSKNTLEFKNGVTVKEFSNFRAYNSFDESFNDYVQYLKSNPRYQQALNVSNDPIAYITELSKSGYATDPNYVSKISNIMINDVSPIIKNSSNKNGMIK